MINLTIHHRHTLPPRMKSGIVPYLAIHPPSRLALPRIHSSPITARQRSLEERQGERGDEVSPSLPTSILICGFKIGTSRDTVQAEQSTWETDARCGKEECDTSTPLKSRSRNALRIAYECDVRVRHPLGLSLSLSLSLSP